MLFVVNDCFLPDRMCLYAEKELSTSQDVTGAYFNRGIFSGAMSSGGSTSSP
jgi:hypothetical protein